MHRVAEAINYRAFDRSLHRVPFAVVPDDGRRVVSI
jgi:hypothetical protein